MLADPAITAVNIVTTPEEMPVARRSSSSDGCATELTVPLGTVVVNRVLPELFTHADEADVRSAARARRATRCSKRAPAPASTAVLDGARLAVSLRRTRAVHLDALREAVDLPLLYLPYLFVRAHGLRVTRMVADALGQELGL